MANIISVWVGLSDTTRWSTPSPGASPCRSASPSDPTGAVVDRRRACRRVGTRRVVGAARRGRAGRARQQRRAVVGRADGSGCSWNASKWNGGQAGCRSGVPDRRAVPCLEGDGRVTGQATGLTSRRMRAPRPRNHRCGTAPGSHRTSLRLRQFDIVLLGAYAPQAHDRPRTTDDGRRRPHRRPPPRRPAQRRLARRWSTPATERASRRRHSG